MKKFYYYFLIICISASGQENNYQTQDFKNKSDSLMISIVGAKIFENYFTSDTNTTLEVEYLISINGEIYKKVKILYNQKGELKTKPYLLKRSLKEFVNIEKLKPKISLQEAFIIAKKSGFEKINEVSLNINKSLLVWFIYYQYKMNS